MTADVLVTYASQYGATKEIAEKMGEVLGNAGVQADILPVDSVKDLTPYRAVILGSGIYAGNWPKKSAAFLTAQEKSLAERSVWIFTSGPTGEGDPVELVKGQRLPASLQPVADRIKPRDVAVFHGYINPAKINFFLKWMIKNVVKAPFGDFRDWNMIVSWTDSIASALKAA